jgi:4-hydroxybenzoyl-CoA reductase subunit beta
MNLLPDFRYHRPESLDEAARLKGTLPAARFLAGGTDLLVNLRRGLGEPSDLIDLGAVAELSALRREGDSLWLGAGVTLDRIARDAEIASAYPALTEAAASVAGPTHRAAATLGGNLCQDTRCVFYNQSEWWREANNWCLKYQGSKCHVVAKSDRCYATYHGDVAPVLIVLDAEAVVVSAGGTRRLKVAELYRESGAEHLTLEAGEVLAAVVVPPQGRRGAGYAKIRVRDAIDFPLAGIAASLERKDDVIGELRIAITGTNSAPLLIPTEELQGRPWDADAASRLTQVVRKKANVLATTITGPKYRRRVLFASMKRLVDELWAKG